MFHALTLGILLLAVMTWRTGGLLRTLCIAWLICLAPVATGAVTYDYLSYVSDTYIWLIGASFVAFLIGSGLAAVRQDKTRISATQDYDWDADLKRWWPVARVCVVISIVAVISMLTNAYLLGADLLNLASLRQRVIEAESANIFARLGAISIWACFFCFSFAVYFRDRLAASQLIVLLLTVVGVLLSALTTAGRQAPMQLALLTLFLEAFRSQRLARRERRDRLLKFTVLSIAAALIMYVTVNRGSTFQQNQADTFLRLFQAHLSAPLESFLLFLGDNVRNVVTEAMLYISHSVPLFAISAEVDYGGPYLGAMNFPFIMRQLEPVFGIDVANVLDLRTFALNAERVIGVGWDTTLSALIMDFGVPGMLIAMASLGYAGQKVIMQVRRGAGFPVIVIASVLMLVCAYMPFLSVIADTNIFFLLVATTLMALFVPHPRRHSRLNGPAVPQAGQ